MQLFNDGLLGDAALYDGLLGDAGRDDRPTRLDVSRRERRRLS